jgi:predicted nucleic acid-binding protein
VARHGIRTDDAERRRRHPALAARPLTLVVDASIAVVAALSRDGFSELGDESLVAPPLMWPEARSALHELAGRREISVEDAEAARARLDASPVAQRSHVRLGAEAWRLADDFGWTKTYDAEYVALAQLLGCRLVTLDARLRRATDRLGIVISPMEV